MFNLYRTICLDPTPHVADLAEAVPTNRIAPRVTESDLKTGFDLFVIQFCKIHNFKSTRPSFANFISMDSEKQALANHALCLVKSFW